MPDSWRMEATNWFLRLWRLLPLPWAKTTTPEAFGGMIHSASRCMESTGIWTIPEKVSTSLPRLFL